MSYFTIPINAGSEEERASRIAENESRGFELVKTFEREKEHKSWGNHGYRVGNEAVFKYAGSDLSKQYCAIMRRCNIQYLKQKAAQSVETVSS